LALNAALKLHLFSASFFKPIDASSAMSLKFENRFPSGNARRISVKQEGDLTEVAFAPEPGGGAECLWFYFRLTETSSAPT
jgi:hypothetical protein